MFTGTRGHRHSMSAGLWVLAGILLFTVLEMACPDPKEEEETEEKTLIEPHVNNNVLSNETSASSTYNVNAKTNHISNNGSKIYLNGSSSHSNHTNANYTKAKINVMSDTKCYSNYPNGTVSHDSTKIRKNGTSNGHTKHVNGVNDASNGKKDNGDAKQSSNSNISAVKPPVKQV